MSEQELWKGSPSQITNFVPFFLAFLALAAGIAIFITLHSFMDAEWKGSLLTYGLLIWCPLPILYGFIKWLKIRSIRYEMTSERLILRTGIFSKATEEFELYRAKDISVFQPFFLRMFKLGHITLVTSDRSNPQIELTAVPNPEELRKQIREHVEACRVAKGVTERDFE